MVVGRPGIEISLIYLGLGPGLGGLARLLESTPIHPPTPSSAMLARLLSRARPVGLLRVPRVPPTLVARAMSSGANNSPVNVVKVE